MAEYVRLTERYLFVLMADESHKISRTMSNENTEKDKGRWVKKEVSYRTPKTTKIGDICNRCATVGVVAHFIVGERASKICDHCGILSMDSGTAPIPVYRRVTEEMTEEMWDAFDEGQEEERRLRNQGY